MTRQQRRLYDYLVQQQDKGLSIPSYEEIRVALGYKSRATIHRLVTALIERGHLRRIAGRARSLSVVVDPVVTRLPVVRITDHAMASAEAGAKVTGKSLTDYVSSCILYYGVGHR